MRVGSVTLTGLQARSPNSRNRRSLPTRLRPSFSTRSNTSLDPMGSAARRRAKGCLTRFAASNSAIMRLNWSARAPYLRAESRPGPYDGPAPPLLEPSRRLTGRGRWLKPEIRAINIFLYKTKPRVIDFPFDGFESRRMGSKREDGTRLVGVLAA
jgi:hypothetical protein